MIQRLVLFLVSGSLLAASGATPPELSTEAKVILARGQVPHPLPPAASPLPPVTPEVVAHGPRDGKALALTFDACSTRSPSYYDERITKVLVETKTPATIFIGGHWAQEEVGHLQYLAASPLFELGNHTFSHPHMKEISEDRMRAEFLETQAAVQAITGREPRLFRPPYGEYDERVVRVAGEMGLTTVEYDLPSGDPDQHATKEKLIEWVLRKAQPGSIIVMHINHVKFHTAEALPGIIHGLRAKGFELVTVGELIRREHSEQTAPVASTTP
jgi:peptidoglycan/xylan/chitin deacetylase (PgdA/CDA1 family)